MGRAIERSELQLTINAVAREGSSAAAGRVLGIPESTVKHRLSQAKARGLVAEGSAGDPKVRIAQLEKDLKAATREQADTAVLKQLIGTAAMKLDTLELPAWTVKPSKDANAPGVPTLQLSDFHWGERVFPKQVNNVNDYSVSIARERLRYCIETAVHLCRILDRDMRYQIGRAHV